MDYLDWKKKKKLSHYAHHIYDTLFFLLFDQDVFVLKSYCLKKKNLIVCFKYKCCLFYVIFSVYILAFAYYIGL